MCASESVRLFHPSRKHTTRKTRFPFASHSNREPYPLSDAPYEPSFSRLARAGCGLFSDCGCFSLQSEKPWVSGFVENAFEEQTRFQLRWRAFVCMCVFTSCAYHLGRAHRNAGVVSNMAVRPVQGADIKGASSAAPFTSAAMAPSLLNGRARQASCHQSIWLANWARIERSLRRLSLFLEGRAVGINTF